MDVLEAKAASEAVVMSEDVSFPLNGGRALKTISPQCSPDR